MALRAEACEDRCVFGRAVEIDGEDEVVGDGLGEGRDAELPA